MAQDPQKIADAIKTLTEAAIDNPELLIPLNKGKGTLGSNYSYYKLDNGLMVKKIVDALLDDPSKDKKVKYTDFNSASRNSVYVRCWQGFRYLIDNLDTPDGKYLKARKRIVLSKASDGIKFIFKKDITKIEPENVLKEEERNSWKDTFDEFIEGSSSGDIYHRTDVELTDGDFEYIKRSITNMPFKLFKLTKTEIKIGREIE